MQQLDQISEKTLVDRLQTLCDAKPNAEVWRMLSGPRGPVEAASFAQLWSQSAGFAELLREYVAPGARALILLPQTMDYLRAFLGCQLAGVLAVTLFPPKSGSIGRFAAIIEDCGAEVAFITRESLSVIEETISRFPPLARVRWLVVEDIALCEQSQFSPHRGVGSDVAFLQYTSGSTAAPKGVMVTQDNILRHSESLARMAAMDASSVIVSWLPLFHDFGMLGIALQSLCLGARAVMMSPMTFAKRPLFWLESIDEYAATHAGGPNFGFQACVDAASKTDIERLDLSSWYCAWNGAEPIRPATLRAFTERFAPHGFSPRALAPCYGLAEATLCVSHKRHLDAPKILHIDGKQAKRRRAVPVSEGSEGALAIVGCGAPEMEVRIVDEGRHTQCEDGTIGEIWVRGPSVVAGYWDKPELSDEIFGAEIVGRSGQKFLRTGDLGFVREGELFVAGRIKDLMIIRGENIYPQDVELTAESSHPALRRGNSAAFVLNESDEALVLVQEVQRGFEASHTAGTIAACVRTRVADEHGVEVREVVLIRQGSIPKTSSGKIQRGATRKAYMEGSLQTIGGIGLGTSETAAAGAP